MVQRYNNIPDSFIYFDIRPFIGEQNRIQFTLSHAGKFDFDTAFLADQLLIYPKAKSKLPSFTGVYAHFTPQSFEQSSSEVLAFFKADCINGEQILDLSGGLGVDDWAFASKFKRVVSLDIDDQLNKIVRRNFEKLGVSNIERLDDDAYDFVGKNVDKYDWVYLDSDRRASAKRAIVLADAEPNILTIRHKLFGFTSNILLKVSPMLDIHALMNELKTIKQIWVVSHKNEVKEILVHLINEPCETIISAVDLDGEQKQQFALMYPFTADQVDYKNTGSWFYEPGLALIKSYLATPYLQQNQVHQLAKNSIYGLSEMEVPNFFGRVFKVVSIFEFSKAKLKAYLQRSTITKANIAKRNFPMEVAELRKMSGLKDGGEHYFFFSMDASNTKQVFHCIKHTDE